MGTSTFSMGIGISFSSNHLAILIKISQTLKEAGKNYRNLSEEQTQSNKGIEYSNKAIEYNNKALESQIAKQQRLERTLVVVNQASSKMEENRSEQMKNSSEEIKKRAVVIGAYGDKLINTGMNYSKVLANKLGGVVRSVLEYEVVFSDVKNQFDLGTKEKANEFKNELYKVITDAKIPMTLNEVYTAAKEAGEMGVAKEDVVNHIIMSKRMGQAFSMAGNEAGSAMLKLKNAFNIPQNELSTLLDQITMLGDTTGAKSREIADYATKVGELGNVAGFSESQIAAIGATLIAGGQSTENAAKGFNKISLALMSGENATESQIEAYKKLGLNYKDVASGMQSDTNATFNTVLERLKELDKTDLDALTSELFGGDSKETISVLLTNKEKMNTNISNTQDKNLYENRTEKTAKTNEDSTVGNQIKKLEGKKDVIIDKFGTALLPSLIKVADTVESVLGMIISFQSENPVLFEGLIENAIYAGGAIFGLGGILKGVSIGMQAYSTGMKVYSGAMKLYGQLVESEFAGKIITSIHSISKAAMGFITSNPYVAIGAAIIAVGYLIYKNWDYLKAKAIELWQTVTNAFKKVGKFLGISESVTGIDVETIQKGNDNFDSNVSTLGEKDIKMEEVKTEIAKSKNTPSPTNFVYSPQITSENPSEIERILKEDSLIKQKEFEEMHKRMEENKQRVGG